MLVKLQRPPPEMRIFLPTRSAWSSNDDAAAAAACLDGAHHAGGARAEDYDINLLHSPSPLRLSRFMMA